MNQKLQNKFNEILDETQKLLEEQSKNLKEGKDVVDLSAINQRTIIELFHLVLTEISDLTDRIKTIKAMMMEEMN
jgi:hypothetical protein